jgi:hypothetical protein
VKGCTKCGRAWEGRGSPGFQETCQGCGEYLHGCKNCRLHDPAAHNQCKSPTTDPVRDREAMNRCEEFDLAETGGARGRDDRAAQARRKLEEMFGS